jgi:hypothetical protein
VEAPSIDIAGACGSRYTDHLDDMPAIGYAISSLAADRIEKYLLLLYGYVPARRNSAYLFGLVYWSDGLLVCRYTGLTVY